MDGNRSSSAVTCTRCANTFILPEEEVEGNLPRVLICGHIFCTSCLQTIECSGVIECPDCEVKSNLPEDGVYGLQGDSRIIGLIYTAKMNKTKRSKNHRRSKLPDTDINPSTEDMEQRADIEKIEKAVDEALASAAENLAVLEHLYETLTMGLAEQVKRERAQLEMEIKQAADKAVNAIQKWREVQLSQLTKLVGRFPRSRAEVNRIRERMKGLETAMQIARKVRRVPFLEQHCILDEVLKTLQAPVDNQSFDMKCITLASGMSYVCQLDAQDQSLGLSLKVEVGHPKDVSVLPPKCQSPGVFCKKSVWQHKEARNSSPIVRSKLPSSQKQKHASPELISPSSGGSSPSPRPRCRLNQSHHTPPSESQDVIIEEVLENEEDGLLALPPSGPELVNDKWRIHTRGRKQLSGCKRNVTQWVVVTHVVNPSHFYVHYVAEKREIKIVSKKINHFCCTESCCFSSSDTVETGSMIFVKWKEGLWCRARMVEIFQDGCIEAVKTCQVTQLSSVRVFFIDYGYTKSIAIESKESSLAAVNSHLRKVDEAVNVELGGFVPQAVRCSLKDLVPYDLTKGWSEEAQVEFRHIVSSAAVEMRPLGQDRDSLLVDLRKAPMDQTSDAPISVREYLVFIEVARFYSPVTSGRRPLLYYPPVYPNINTELNAVVSHINSPADFHIQLVDNMEYLLLSAKLQDCYNVTTKTGEDDLIVYCPVVGQACVARYEDNLWYRAQVIGHPGGHQVEVRYVDFGNKKTVSVSDLRKMKDEFFSLPSMAIQCCLSNVLPLDGETWSDACTNRFISLVHQKLVTLVATARVPKTKPLPVRLFESGLDGPLANIAELLVAEKLACFSEKLMSKDASSTDDEPAVWDPPLEHDLSTEVLNSSKQYIHGERDTEPFEFQPQLKFPVDLKDLKVRVSHVNSPSSFYIQFAQYDSQLKRVCELLKQECVSMDPQDVVWKEDMFCAANINGIWERGQICSEVTSSDIAEVIRCDHGNKVKLHISNLRQLPSSLSGSLALECTLTDIRPAGGGSTWTATACDFISHYLAGASAVMTIKELTEKPPVPVDLFRTNKMGEFVSMSDFLASKGLALKERKPSSVEPAIQKTKEIDALSPASEMQADCSGAAKINTPPPAPSIIPLSSTSSVSTFTHPKPARRSIMSAEKVKTQLYHPPELPCLGHIKATISAIGEDGLIYVTTQDAERQLEELRERIQQNMKTLPRQKPYTWKSVQGCAVIGPDMLWYRGQLLEVMGGHVRVQYVDYGLVENIPVVHVSPMLLCHDVPQLCVPCQLHSVKPLGGKWQIDAVALLKELLLNRSVDIQVVEVPTDPRDPLTVELLLDGLRLSRILCHHRYASIDQTVTSEKGHSVPSGVSFLDDWDIDTKGLRGPEELMLGPFIYPNLPQKGERFQVRVKHLLTPNELFLWPLEGAADVLVDGETLDEALTRINENIQNLPRLTNFPKDGPCLAEYSDGKYYRAKLIKFLTMEPVMVLVQHVDFGSDDTLPTSKLRQMPAELLQFPSHALKVHVGGFKAPAVNKQENVLPYSPEWSVQAALDMIDLLHSNITAAVVTCEPELTVLLYDENEELVHIPLVKSGLAELC